MLTRCSLRKLAAGLTAGALLLLLLPAAPEGESAAASPTSVSAPGAQTIAAAGAPDDDDSDLPDAGFDAEVPETSVLFTPEEASVAARLQSVVALSARFVWSRRDRGPPVSPQA